MRRRFRARTLDCLEQNKTEKAFSPIGCGINDKSYRFMKILGMPDNCLATTRRLTDSCLALLEIRGRQQTRKLHAYEAARNCAQAKKYS